LNLSPSSFSSSLSDVFESKISTILLVLLSGLKRDNTHSVDVDGDQENDHEREEKAQGG
jgi:hypothetical protein